MSTEHPPLDPGDMIVWTPNPRIYAHRSYIGYVVSKTSRDNTLHVQLWWPEGDPPGYNREAGFPEETVYALDEEFSIYHCSEKTARISCKAPPT